MHDLAIRCFHCGEDIRSTSDPLFPWVHEHSGNAFCDVFGPQDAVVRVGEPERTEARPDVERLYSDAVAALDEHYCFDYIDRDDELTNNQLQILLDGKYLDDEDDYFDEWVSERRYLDSQHVLDDMLSPQQRDLLDERIEDLRQEVYDRDTGDLGQQLLHATGCKLVRFDLEHTVDPYPWNAEQEELDARAAGIAEALHLEPTPEQRNLLQDLVTEASYGGTLYAFCYLDGEEALRLATGGDERPKTVTFTPARIVVLDHLNGSGSEIELPSITVPWSEHRVTLDARGIGFGYSWDEVCGLHKPYYRCEFTFPTEVKEAC